MKANPIAEFLQRFRRTALLHEGKEQTDDQLLERFVGGRDSLALETLVLRHAPMVWGVCRRTLAHQDDAEDAFQATFLVFIRKAASIRSRALLANWLYGVAHQTARKARQRAAKRYTREKQVETMPEPQTQPQDDDFEPELLARLDEELSRLPEKYRSAVVLCDLECRTRADAAQQLCVAEGTVASRLARGREMLTKRLVRHGLGRSATSLAALCSQQTMLVAVPAVLLTHTIKTLNLIAVGETVATGLISTGVSALTEGVLHAMAMAKKKAASVLLVMAALVMGGGGTVAYHIHNKKASDLAKAQQEAIEDAKIEADINRFGNAEDAKEFGIKTLKTHGMERVDKAQNGEPIIQKMRANGMKATLDPKTKHWSVTGIWRSFDWNGPIDFEMVADVSYSPFGHAWQWHLTRMEAKNHPEWKFPKKLNRKARMPVTFADLRSMPYIDMLNSKVTDEDLRHFHGLKALRVLRIAGNNVSEAGLRDLQKASPDCTIIVNGDIYELSLFSRLWPFK